MNPLSRIVTFTLLAAAMLAMTGCGYTLHGRVVEGSYSHMSIAMPEEAERAREAVGVRGVQIAIYRDPGRPSQQLVATGTSSADGSFAIPLSGAFGAGWMEEVWLVQVTRQGYTSVEEIVTLPVNSPARPLIVTVSRGRSMPFTQPDDYHRDLERFR